MSTFKWNINGRTVTTRAGEWTGWHIDDDGIKTNAMIDDLGWTHNLATNPDETDPDRNHVHFKFKGNGADVLCSVKTDGMREINRGLLIDCINATTSLNLSYR